MSEIQINGVHLLCFSIVSVISFVCGAFVGYTYREEQDDNKGGEVK